MTTNRDDAIQVLKYLIPWDTHLPDLREQIAALSHGGIDFAPKYGVDIFLRRTDTDLVAVRVARDLSFTWRFDIARLNNHLDTGLGATLDAAALEILQRHATVVSDIANRANRLIWLIGKAVRDKPYKLTAAEDAARNHTQKVDALMDRLSELDDEPQVAHAADRTTTADEAPPGALQ